MCTCLMSKAFDVFGKVRQLRHWTGVVVAGGKMNGAIIRRKMLPLTFKATEIALF